MTEYDDNELFFYIMRGIPGSGKSYTAKQIADAGHEGLQGLIVSADYYFDNLPGGYRANWKPELLGKAHGCCMFAAQILANQKYPLIIIDNTNINIKDVVPYAQMAKDNGYELIIQEATSDWWLEIQEFLWANPDDAGFKRWAEFLAQKTTHGVPKETLEKMLRKYNPYTEEDLLSKTS